MLEAIQPTDQLLRRPDVEQLTGLRRSTMYRLIAEGRFPAAVRLTERAVAWRASEVAQWVASRKSAGAAS
jgi:prophage regulatory protein